MRERERERVRERESERERKRVRERERLLRGLYYLLYTCLLSKHDDY